MASSVTKVKFRKIVMIVRKIRTLFNLKLKMYRKNKTGIIKNITARTSL